MKSLPYILLMYLPTIICLVSAGVIASLGQASWGWFLIAGVFLAGTISLKFKFSE